MGVVTSLKIISSSWHLGSIWECSAIKCLGEKMNKSTHFSWCAQGAHVTCDMSVGHSGSVTHFLSLVYARKGWTTSMSISHWSKMWRKAFISLKFICLSPFHQAEHPCLIFSLASTPGVAVSPRGVSGAQRAWDGCCAPVLAPFLVEKLPKFQSQGSFASQQGTAHGLSCWAGHRSCCWASLGLCQDSSSHPTALPVLLIVSAGTHELFQQERNGWHSMKSFWKGWSWCCWEAWVAQGGKRHSDLQSIRGFRLTSGSDRRVYPARRRLEALHRPLCSQLFYLFVSHLPSFPWWTEMKVVCTPLQASSEIQFKYLILGAYGRAEPLNLFHQRVTVPELFFGLVSGIMDIQNWDWTLKLLWERLVELNVLFGFQQILAQCGTEICHLAAILYSNK